MAPFDSRLDSTHGAYIIVSWTRSMDKSTDFSNFYTNTNWTPPRSNARHCVWDKNFRGQWMEESEWREEIRKDFRAQRPVRKIHPCKSLDVKRIFRYCNFPSWRSGRWKSLT